jgi:hypothetical protein
MELKLITSHRHCTSFFAERKKCSLFIKVMLFLWKENSVFLETNSTIKEPYLTGVCLGRTLWCTKMMHIYRLSWVVCKICFLISSSV